MIKIFGMHLSGNCHKIRTLQEHLGRPYEWHEVDILKGASHTPEFLAMNPNGKTPAVLLEDGRPLWESNAILFHLAEGTPLLPDDSYLRAQVLQWMFFEQYSHEPAIAVARFICLLLPSDTPRRAELPRLHERGYQALAVMEQHLKQHDYLVGDRFTIADIALHAYTWPCSDGGFELSGYPAVSAWVARVAALPGVKPMRAA